MTQSITDFIAFITLVLWPAVPLFWVPVHCLPNFFKRLDLLTYVLPFVTWLPVAYVVYHYRDFLLDFQINFPFIVEIIGVLILVSGAALQVWTLLLLKVPAIMGVPEVTSRVRSGLVTSGPFSIVRHPTYVSHTLMLTGVFLWTGVIATGFVVLADLLAINIVVIPLEEKELVTRFGKEYERYKEKVRSRFLPWKFHKKR